MRRSRAVAGRWLLLEEVGRGATATVHRARDLTTGAYVAAKVARGPGCAALVEERHRAPDHPHVLPVHGWAVADDLAVLATELVPEGSLRDRLAREGALPPAQVARLLGQLLDALAAVHARGLVHADVKPANLLLRGGDHLLLADFGVAVPAGRTAPVAGTPAYLPPERQAGADPDPSQDVYATGVLGRRITRGGAPFLTLCDSMARREAEKRPTAAQAAQRLRELTVGGRA